MVAVCYYQDARDLSGITGPYENINVWGWDDYESQWSSSSGHGSTYADATHITNADNNTDELLASFTVASGNYELWVYVNGGSTEDFMLVSVEGSLLQTVSLSVSNSWNWQLVSGGPWTLSGSILISFSSLATAYLYGLRGIILTTGAGAPSYIPSGYDGDDSC